MFFNIFKKKEKKTLIGYFLSNKLTFPIVQINNMHLVFSHGNSQDVSILCEQFPELKVTKISHKKYDCVVLLQLKTQLALIVDEYYCDNIINTLLDIRNSDVTDWLNYSKTDNVIYPTFGINK